MCISECVPTYATVVACGEGREGLKKLEEAILQMEKNTDSLDTSLLIDMHGMNLEQHSTILMCELCMKHSVVCYESYNRECVKRLGDSGAPGTTADGGLAGMYPQFTCPADYYLYIACTAGLARTPRFKNSVVVVSSPSSAMDGTSTTPVDCNNDDEDDASDSEDGGSGDEDGDEDGDATSAAGDGDEDNDDDDASMSTKKILKRKLLVDDGYDDDECGSDEETLNESYYGDPVSEEEEGSALESDAEISKTRGSETEKGIEDINGSDDGEVVPWRSLLVHYGSSDDDDMHD